MRKGLFQTSLLVCLLFWLRMADAQPLPIWWRLYDHNFEGNWMMDIYHLADGGFATTGESGSDPNHADDDHYWLTRLDANGRTVWERTYREHWIGYAHLIGSIIEADNGDLLTAGAVNGNVGVLRVNADGEVVWWCDTEMRGHAVAIIELKAGDFAVAGCARPAEQGSYLPYLLKINGEGQVIWSIIYRDICETGRFYGLREVNGDIVASGWARIGFNEGQNRIIFNCLVSKVSGDGEQIWFKGYDIGDEAGNPAQGISIVTCPGGDLAIAGVAQTLQWTGPYILDLNSDGELQWLNYWQPDGGDNARPFCLTRYNDGFLMVGWFAHGNPNGTTRKPFALATDAQGNKRWLEVYELDQPQVFDPGFFSSVVVDAEGCAWAAGHWLNNNDPDYPHSDGLIVKLEPDQQNPLVNFYQPEDTVFSRLPGDTLTFLVRAHDQQSDAMSYLWTFDGDTVGNDSTYFATFPDEYRECPVRCIVSDDKGNSTIITWHVNIVPFYISEVQPDSTALAIHRKSTVDFGVALRSVPGDQFKYLWKIRGDSAGIDSVMTHEFAYAGNCRVTVNVSRDGWIADTAWSVKVVGLIGDWWPEATDTTVTQGDSLYFDVLPYKRGDDTLRYLWTLNADSVSSDSEVCVTFPDLREQKVTGYILTASDSDSVSWRINVIPKQGIPNSSLCILHSALDSPYPNPFNQSSVVSYQLSVGGKVNLSLYDISGRLMGTLVNSWQSAGAHRAAIGVSNQQSGISNQDLPTGIYFLRLQAGREVMTKKAVVIR